MIHLTKNRQLFVLVTRDNEFYKLQKLIYNKTKTEKN